jgi:hypothetical protein
MNIEIIRGRIVKVKPPVKDDDVATKGYVNNNAGGDTANIAFIEPDSVGSVENSTTETDVLNWTLKANTLADGEALDVDMNENISNAGGNARAIMKIYAGTASVQVANAYTYDTKSARVGFSLVRKGTSLIVVTKHNASYGTRYGAIGDDASVNNAINFEITGLDFTADIAMKLTATLDTALAGTGLAVKTAEIKHIKLLSA